MDKFVITIARGYGSGGRTLGKKLAKELGIGYYDREILSLTASATGIDEQFFANADEKLMGTQLYKIASNVYRGEKIKPENENILSNDNLYMYQAKVIKELSKWESFVIIGRCADYILEENKNVLNIFVHAPMKKCVERLEELSSLTEEQLKELINKTDEHRAQYYYYNTHRMWNDARHYDLCINTEELTIDECVELVKSFLKIKCKTNV